MRLLALPRKVGGADGIALTPKPAYAMRKPIRASWQLLARQYNKPEGACHGVSLNVEA